MKLHHELESLLSNSGLTEPIIQGIQRELFAMRSDLTEQVNALQSRIDLLERAKHKLLRDMQAYVEVDAPRTTMNITLNHAKSYVFANQTHVLIGRSRSNDIVLSDDRVSKHHAQLFLRDGKLYLQDLNSANGVYINGELMSGAQELISSDWIQISDTSLRVELTL